MDFVLEILKLMIPAGIVAAAVYFVLQSYMDNQEKLKRIELNLQKKNNLNAPKMQAYERMILFLERNTPDVLAMRLRVDYKNAEEMQAGMIQTIKKEFDHNITQQLYISGEAWKLAVQAKEESIKIINIAASKCGEEASEVDLTKMILSICSQITPMPTKVAIEGLKREFRSKYGN